VDAALQLGIDPARRLEFEAAGAGPGDGRALDAAARQQVAGSPGLVDRLAIAWRRSSQPRRCWAAP